MRSVWTESVTVHTIVNCWRHTDIIDFDDNEEIEQGEEAITFEIEKDITALRYLIFRL